MIGIWIARRRYPLRFTVELALFMQKLALDPLNVNGLYHE